MIRINAAERRESYVSKMNHSRALAQMLSDPGRGVAGWKSNKDVTVVKSAIFSIPAVPRSSSSELIPLSSYVRCGCLLLLVYTLGAFDGGGFEVQSDALGGGTGLGDAGEVDDAVERLLGEVEHGANLYIPVDVDFQDGAVPRRSEAADAEARRRASVAADPADEVKTERDGFVAVGLGGPAGPRRWPPPGAETWLCGPSVSTQRPGCDRA
jgi:hypothetical protein